MYIDLDASKKGFGVLVYHGARQVKRCYRAIINKAKKRMDIEEVNSYRKSAGQLKRNDSQSSSLSKCPTNFSWYLQCNRTGAGIQRVAGTK